MARFRALISLLPHLRALDRDRAAARQRRLGIHARFTLATIVAGADLPFSRLEGVLDPVLGEPPTSTTSGRGSVYARPCAARYLEISNVVNAGKHNNPGKLQAYHPAVDTGVSIAGNIQPFCCGKFSRCHRAYRCVTSL